MCGQGGMPGRDAERAQLRAGSNSMTVPSQQLLATGLCRLWHAACMQLAAAVLTPVTCLKRRAAARSSMRACPLRRSPSSARAVSRRKARLSAGSGPFLPAADRASSASMCLISATARPGHEAAVMAAPGGRAAVPASNARSSASLSRKLVNCLSASCSGRVGQARCRGAVTRRADQQAAVAAVAAAGGSQSCHRGCTLRDLTLSLLRSTSNCSRRPAAAMSRSVGLRKQGRLAVAALRQLHGAPLRDPVA